jgi:hypothetical protein
MKENKEYGEDIVEEEKSLMNEKEKESKKGKNGRARKV